MAEKEGGRERGKWRQGGVDGRRIFSYRGYQGVSVRHYSARGGVYLYIADMKHSLIILAAVFVRYS